MVQKTFNAANVKKHGPILQVKDIQNDVPRMATFAEDDIFVAKTQNVNVGCFLEAEVIFRTCVFRKVLFITVM